MTCILTTWSKVGRGYGAKRIGGRQVMHHRLVYAEAHGLDVLTMGGEVLHSCDTPACVNPAHLSLGTHLDNMADMAAKGRSALGERNGQSKLTEADVRWLREVHRKRCPAYGAAALARKLGVSDLVVRQALAGKTWQHVR